MRPGRRRDPMSLDPQKLAAAVLAGDARQVRGLLRDATEADRRACAESRASLAPLLFPRKDVAIRQLKLLGKVAREAPVRPLALATAAGVFGHTRVDVQLAALDLIAQFGLPEGAEAAVIEGHAADRTPSAKGWLASPWPGLQSPARGRPGHRTRSCPPG